MSFESEFNNDAEKETKRYEELKTGFGVALCTKQKEGGTSALEAQTILAEKLNLPAVQFDFRNRTDTEIQESKNVLIDYRETHESTAISIHGETPKIDEVSLDFKNKERVLMELDLLQRLSGESFTVHPPSINLKKFNSLPGDLRDTILQNYSNIFVQPIMESVAKKQRFSIGIENMPKKGENGSWGQEIGDLLMLLRKIEQILVDKGLELEVAHQYVGATLDINHALHGADVKDYKRVLEEWFKGLGDYLKVVHLYTPSSVGEEFNEKYKISLKLASQFNPNARLFMESKQSPDITERLYDAVKNVR